MEICHADDCCCHDKDWILVVSSNSDTNVIINYISMDYKCVQGKYEFNVGAATDYQFIKNEIKKFNAGAGKLKAAIFDLFGMKPSKKRYDFCNFWKAFCNELGIRHQFINTSTLIFTSILCGANIKENGVVTVVHITKTEITVSDLESSYDSLLIKKQVTLNLDCSDKVLKDTVTKGKKSSKIILSIDDSLNTKQYKDILKSPKLLVLAKNYLHYTLKALEVMVNDLNSICKNKFKILTYFESTLFITKQQNSDRFYGSFEIKCLKNTLLPFSEKLDTFVANDEIVVVNIWNGKSLEQLEIFDVSKYAGSHVQLILSIDVNGFYSLRILQIKNLSLISFRKRQQDAYINFDDEDGDGKIAITIPDIGKLKDENGYTTIPPYVSFFNNDLLIIGEEAQQLAYQHPSFVVYDIFALTKMATTSTIKVNLKWGFKVEKDSNGTLQVVFNTWRGVRKATPQFLLAILINHLLKLAKERLGFVPKTVDILVGDNFRFIEKGISAACKRLDESYEIQIDRSRKIIKVDRVFFKVVFGISDECKAAAKKAHRRVRELSFKG